MNNNELKNLLNSIQPTQEEKDQMNSVVNTIENLLKNNVGNIKIAEFHKGGSFAKGTIIKGRKEVDIVVAISPKDPHKLLYKDLANLNMNFIENTFYTQWYEKLENQDSDSKIKRNYDRNTLSMKTVQGVDVDFLVKFKKEQLMNVTDSKVENFYLERDTQQLNFINKANQEYSLFKGSVQLIKHFRNHESLTDLKSYMIEIILYYSLCKYLKSKDYVGYLNAFLNGINDFIDEKTIEVTDKMYQYLKTVKSKLPNGRWKAIDVANRSNNVAEYITESKINKFKDFHNKYKNEFKEQVAKKQSTTSTDNNLKIEGSVDLYYEDDKKQKWQWGYNIQDISQRNGSFPIAYLNSNASTQNKEIVIDSILTACHKCVRFIIKHYKTNELVINLRPQYFDICKNNKYLNLNITNSDKSRIQSLYAYAKQNGINLTFNIVEN